VNRRREGLNVCYRISELMVFNPSGMGCSLRYQEVQIYKRS